MTGGSITFAFQGEGELYGNQVIQRTNYVDVNARRSWIDFDNPLPAGFMERFYIYVHNDVTPLDRSDRRIHLQVWRPVDVSQRRFRLVWSRVVEVSSLGALYSVCCTK